MGDLTGYADTFAKALSKARMRDAYNPRAVAIGRIVGIGEGVARISGLRDVAANELIRLPGKLFGIAASVKTGETGLILLGDADELSVGAEGARTGRVVDVPVGAALQGRVVDARGVPIDGEGPLKATERRPIEVPAPAIMDRAPVEVPLQTGIKSIDSAIPIGRGQRELILGDRQTGKTTIAVDAIINQRERDVVSVYCAIGQRTSAVARVVARLRDAGALSRTIVVVASGEEAPGLQYIAPYAATSMAEHFMRAGRDVLIVYDDLTRHARAYRELSLLLRRPPGREAYPGDIFYLHARLLERATRLKEDLGGGSLTALPIIETQAQNVSAYIPTNLISITDGQIYVSPELFRKGLLPAIDIGTSVSRVGGDAQLAAYRAVAGDLKLSYSQFEELEAFARFGSKLDDDTRHQLERGRRVRQILKQDENELLPADEQISVLLATTSGLLDEVPIEGIRAAERAIRGGFRQRCGEISSRIMSGEKLSDEDREGILDNARHSLRDRNGA